MRDLKDWITETWYPCGVAEFDVVSCRLCVCVWVCEILCVCVCMILSRLLTTQHSSPVVLIWVGGASRLQWQVSHLVGSDRRLAVISLTCWQHTTCVFPILCFLVCPKMYQNHYKTKHQHSHTRLHWQSPHFNTPKSIHAFKKSNNTLNRSLFPHGLPSDPVQTLPQHKHPQALHPWPHDHTLQPAKLELGIPLLLLLAHVEQRFAPGGFLIAASLGLTFDFCQWQPRKPVSQSHCNQTTHTY